MKRDEKIKTNKENLLKALNSNLGMVTSACNAVGLHRSTHFDYYTRDPKYKEAVDEIQYKALDFVESCLLQQIKAGNTVATIFYLKCKGRERGYIDRIENNISFTSDEEARNQLKKLLKDKAGHKDDKPTD